MRTAIIDDLAICREEIKDCLCRYLEEYYGGEVPAIEEFESGEAFLSCFTPETYDLIFIDQYMDGLSGIETAKKIREQDSFVALVFVTTSLAHAVDSYGVRACGYLVKPYTYEEFERTMELAQLSKVRNARFICVEQSKILLRDILWCGQDDHYVEIHTGKRGLLRFRIPFGEFGRLLDPYPQFLTCYKSCMVNMERAERIDGLDFLMDTGERVPFSKRDRKRIQEQFDAYTFRREREEDGL